MANLTGKLEHRITLRLTNQEFQNLLILSDSYKMSPSQFIRFLLDNSVARSQVIIEDYYNKESVNNGEHQTTCNNCNLE